MKEQITRTLVPAIAGGILAVWTVLGDWAASTLDAVIPALPEDSVTQLSTALVAALYYVAVAVFEKYVKPQFGWLLGWAKQPTYEPKR